MNNELLVVSQKKDDSKMFETETKNTVIPFLFCCVFGLLIARSTIGKNPEEPYHVWILS